MPNARLQWSREDRSRNAGFQTPKILFCTEFHACQGFARILGTGPGDSAIQPAAIIEANTGESRAVTQFMPTNKRKTVHAQLTGLGLFFPWFLGVLGTNQNRNAGADARSTP